MQFKLFTAAVAAMTAGLAVAGPVSAPLKARDTNEANQAQFQQQFQQLTSAQATNMPNDAQLAQIRQQVQTAQLTYGPDFQPWYNYDQYYDRSLYDLYLWLYWFYANQYHQYCTGYGVYSNCPAYSW